MENKINIAELLKDCPKGMELDCTMFENVTFVRVDMSRKHFPIEIAVGGIRSIYLSKEGCFHNITLSPESKCVIFPKGKTTWEGFHRPFKDGDIVAYDNELGKVELFIFKEYVRNNAAVCYLFLNGNMELHIVETVYIIKRFATEEEKQKLFDAIKENGYKWNAETKTLEKLPKFKVGDRVKHISAYASGIVVKVTDKGYHIDYPKGEGVCYISFTLEKNYELAPNKFDINTLVPFESKILVRNNKDDIWRPAIYGCINKLNTYVYTMNNSLFYYCIPYEGNEHLLGTTNDCDDFYKIWKE